MGRYLERGLGRGLRRFVDLILGQEIREFSSLPFFLFFRPFCVHPSSPLAALFL